MAHLRAFEAGVSKAAAAAYEAWRAHHDGALNEKTGQLTDPCPVCFRLEWFDPGAPRLVDEAEVDAFTHRVTTREGISVPFSNNPDYDAMCAAGRLLFT